MRAQSGFLLIELCIVLSVIGILIGTCGALLKGYYRRQECMCTRSHQEQILSAVMWFVLREKRLPCPASIESQGVEQNNCRKHWKGLVPFRTLGLSERIAKDGLNRWMSFVVEPSLTEYRSKNSISSVELCHFLFSSPSTLSLLEKDVSIMNHAKEDGIIVILISHGRFFSEKGLQMSACSHMNRQESNTYCYAPSTTDFGVWNDQVAFLTKTHLLKEMGVKCSDYFFPLESPELPQHVYKNVR
ncbi:pilus assembly FimT family protein [Holospora obtusa]|uniref:pilus assembly FimT family protein n=1 Tax=Holospora obtusa TaxID=49893 RepID=UPI0003AEA0FD|nr:type II secretion system protein [Holospora obtusa]